MSSFDSPLERKSSVHWGLIATILGIGGLGIANVFSAARARDPHLWKMQLLFLLVGVTVSMLSLLVDYRFIERIAYPSYILVVVLLGLVPILGRKILGAKRWLHFGAFNLQPSELMKITIVFVLAKFFAEERRDAGYTIRDLIRPFNVTRPFGALAALVIGWNKSPLLTDPVGEWARRLAEQHLGRPPEWDESFGARLLLISFAALYLVLGSLWYRSQTSGTSPFDQSLDTKKRVWLAVWLAPPALLVLLTGVFWNSELLGDPSAVMIGFLVEAGRPGGEYAEFSPVYWFRITLLLLCLVYLVVALAKQLKRGAPELTDIVAPLDLVLVPMGLIAIEPDLGTTLLVGAVAFSIILFVGMRYGSIAILTVFGIVFSYISWFTLMKDYQKQRVLTFLSPESDALGKGYHAQQSMIAVGSGRWTGKGYAAGTQSGLSFLPEQHTDFAFAVWSEEQGFLGGLVLISLYFILVVLTVNIAARARDKFGALLVTGFTALVFWQAFVNMGMVIGMLPIVGVPLPLFSYGGSSLLTVMIGLGITLNVAYRR